VLIGVFVCVHVFDVVRLATQRSARAVALAVLSVDSKIKCMYNMERQVVS